MGGWAARRGGHCLAFASYSVDLEPHDAAVLHGLVSTLGALRDPSVRDRSVVLRAYFRPCSRQV